MPISLALTLTSAIAYTLQFLIFLYLYPSHRERFFRYLVWGWGLFAVWKLLKLAYLAVPLPWPAWWGGLADAGGTAGFLFILAAALAFRWDFGLSARHGLLAAGYVTLVGLLIYQSDAGFGLQPAVGLLVGAPLLVAGALFWQGRRGGAVTSRERLLAGTLFVWGAQRVVAAFVDAEPGTVAALGLYVTYLLCYFVAVFAIVIMVLDRARSEMASMKEFNERLVDGLGEGLDLVDGDFTIRYANRWLTREFGPVVGRRCHEVLTLDGRPCPGCPLAGRHEMTEPARLDVRGPAGRHLVLTCSPVRQPDGQVFLLELVADVTEPERLRARLSEAERLATVGELAAGVAHEIRNPLSAIVNATTLLERDAELDAEERTTIHRAIKKEARRLNGILSEFLVFAQPSPPRRVRGDIRDVVEHVARLIQDDRARAREIVTQVRVAPEVSVFDFDPDQMAQVLWNLAINAVEAMEGRGTLAMDVARLNGHVCVTVGDTGRGIPAEERRRIFEPFYSRKPGGSGLGLAIVRRIVAAHGGQVEIDSSERTGTRFTICLPVGESRE